MNILITLCGRGGSKGIPGKNIKILNGRPLISFSIDVAREFSKIHGADISLSTESSEIKNIAARFGLDTEYMRPEHLATDSIGKVSVIADLLLYEEANKKKQYDIILDLDISSPLRTSEDLSAAFEILQNDSNALNLFSVNKANRNPYFNMVQQRHDGYVDLVKKGAFVTRQSAPMVFELNASFYFYRREFFSLGLESVITDRSLVYIMPHVCFDLDHPLDFEFMEYLLTHNKLGFKL